MKIYDACQSRIPGSHSESRECLLSRREEVLGALIPSERHERWVGNEESETGQFPLDSKLIGAGNPAYEYLELDPCATGSASEITSMSLMAFGHAAEASPQPGHRTCDGFSGFFFIAAG